MTRTQNFFERHASISSIKSMAVINIFSVNGLVELL